jgi:hypothetical protein
MDNGDTVIPPLTQKEWVKGVKRDLKRLLQPKPTITFTSKNFDFTPVSNPYDSELYEK